MTADDLCDPLIWK